MANQNGKSTTEATLNNSEAVFFKYGKQIIIAIVVLIVIIGGFVAYKTLISDPQEQEASTELAKSQTLFNAQQYDQALKGFMKVQSDYGSTEAGNLANLYIALCYAHSANLIGLALHSTQKSLAHLMTKSLVLHHKWH